MKAMVLAAGLGTRLRPLTGDRPKALVMVGGRTMLEITLERLKSFGLSEVIVNTHHYAAMIAEYLRAHENFGMRIEISWEETLLDTGGGLKRAAGFFLEDGFPEDGKAGRDAPFLMHNVDVLSDIDLGRMVDFHRERGALATLAVQARDSSRQLLFDERGELCGRRKRATEASNDELVRAVNRPEALAFTGVHVISPAIFGRMPEIGPFSIIDTYLRLAAEGESIAEFRADQYYWRDLGRPESVAQAARDLETGAVHRR